MEGCRRTPGRDLHRFRRSAPGAVTRPSRMSHARQAYRPASRSGQRSSAIGEESVALNPRAHARCAEGQTRGTWFGRAAGSSSHLDARIAPRPGENAPLQSSRITEYQSRRRVSFDSRQLFDIFEQNPQGRGAAARPTNLIADGPKHGERSQPPESTAPRFTEAVHGAKSRRVEPPAALCNTLIVVDFRTKPVDATDT